ncbi:O-linked N-acetylglucosamine transferase, SPINDLY family protein [Shinella zoogloeoides]|uniref:protein O-GlcNAc transferase n=1 Tax=Shinella zoogloeoides TaxID=352475 RepID=A0A6N8TKJ1_SHIZO|nr:glycosyl transferase [Shinella zoogloeoides]MXO01640.1 glycosyl transferase [Shinella zoogloeoides]UEX82087.1 glycosyl transferase [Shinella zoogloeoides]
MTVSPSTVPDPNAPLLQLLLRARTQQLSLADLFQTAETLAGAGQKAAAVELYKTWIAFNDANPLLHLAYFNYGVALSSAGDIAGAMHALRAAIRLNPLFGQAHINLGRALEDCGLIGEAVQQWRVFVDATAEMTPDKLSNRLLSLQHIGRVLEGAGQLDEAEAALWQAMELQPSRPEAAQHWISLRARQCKWPVTAPSMHLTMRNFMDAMSSMTIACYADDPLFHLAKAYRYGHRTVGRPADLAALERRPVRMKTGTGQRLRIGYVSSDLRQHAVGFALSEVLELHDKANVEVFAYYCGDPAPIDQTQARIKLAVDHWRDIAGLGDLEAARQIVDDEIDVLIDVNGYTKNARTRIFAYRPAPVIVNFCGYPGTMATPYHQYMIADDVIVPPENELYYTEKVLRIACNQPVDRKRAVSSRPTRAAAGLPEDAFVFASFNGMQKITAPCFARWLAILHATPGSVLWLLAGDDSANERLRKMASDAGIAPERLIFAGKAMNPDHLARIGLADLFLDTFPYGAHSTAADAVTQGLPVLTVAGKSFASRFCASIVTAAGVPELVCSGPDEYVRKAVAFARDPASLRAVRDAIERQRETAPLRDMPALALRLEELFWQMQNEAERGETPVPDLRNLDIYYEVGTELAAQGIEFEDEEAYRARYRAELAALDAFAPLSPDARLWQGDAP